MDADIHAALFDDADEEGDFEELQDDFITEVGALYLFVTCVVTACFGSLGYD